MKKIIALLLAVTMSALLFVGCGGSESSSNNSSSDNGSSQASDANASTGDWSYIADKGNLVIGITYFEPMNYLDDNGELTGFETEFARAVCKKLGVEAKFQKIDWDSKEVELNAKTIDCIWNGMSITDERRQNMGISTPYMENKQVMVTKEINEDKYTSAEALKGATVVAEKKSAGEDVAKSDDFFKQANYIGVDSQAKALLEVKSGTADVAIIDYVMSIGTLTDGSDYDDIEVIDEKAFAPEQYGIAVRKNDTETLKKINEAIDALAKDGTLEKIAEKYDLEDLLLVGKD